MRFGCQSMVGEVSAIILKRARDAFISQGNLSKEYEKFGYIACPDFERTIKEYEIFEKIIADNVPNVYYLPFDSRTGLDSIYAHDSFKVTNSGAIYFPMGKKLRGMEWLAAKDYLESIGVPTLGVITAPGKIEGGDIVWLDNESVAIGRGYRTNDEGIRQFKELTKKFIKNYTIVPMPHGEGEDACLHLMSVISMVDRDLAVVYSKYMPVFFRQMLLERGVKLLEVNDKEYDYLGSNVLALAPRKCVMIEGNSEIEKLLKAEKCTVFTYPGHDLSYLGTGGPTCLTQPICRL